MQSQRLFLVTISLFAVFLSVGCQNPLDNEAYSAPYAVVQQETERDNFSHESDLSLVGVKSGFDGERFEEISGVLKMIKTGRTTLSLIDSYEIDVVFEPGNGSRFNPNTNQIILDSNFGRFSAALILIHEVTHARYFHEGLAADVTSAERETFAHAKVEEEMVAVVSNIEAKMEFEELGVDISDIQSALYYTYRQAYGTAFRAAKWDYPGIDLATLQAIGRDAGRSAVLEALLDGKAVTSNTQESYMDYWRSEWDKKHDAL